MKRWITWFARACAGGVLLAGTAGAQPAPAPSGDAGLAPAFEAAWSRAALAREASGQVRRAQADQTVARSWSAGSPSVELGYRDDRWQSDSGSRETEIGVAWPLWMPSQRAASGRAADASLALAQAATQAARLRLAGEVRESYWSVVAQQADLAEAESHAKSMRQLADDVERRVVAGDLARADALAAHAERLAASSRQVQAAERLAASRSRWAALTGVPVLPPTTSNEPAPAPSTPAELDAHPDLQVARLTATHARHRLDLTLASRRDAPEVMLGARQDVPGRGESTANSVLLRLRVPIGTAARNQPLEAAASGDLDLAQINEQRTHERLVAELAIARTALTAAEQQVDAERERAALLRERANLLDQSFRAGESPLPDTLRALAAAAQAEAALSQQTAALGSARARLQQALGRLP